jgi:hypothetical protein
MGDRELKAALFEKGARALASISSYDGTTYACPTCTRLLRKADLGNGELTLEHVPPESLGGRGIVLTCERCNSTAGHTVDAAAHHRQRFLSLGALLAGRGGEFEGSVTIKIAGISTNARIRFVGQQMTIEVHERDNPPQRFEEQHKALKDAVEAGQPEDLRFDMNARIRFKFDRARVSDLRAAYLAAFAQFGYRYALRPELNAVREQIMAPDSPISDGAWWVAGAEIPEDPMMILVHAPLEGLLVRLGHVLVVLPWIRSESNFYEQVRETLIDRTVEFKGEVLPWPESMVMLLDLAK